MIEIGHDKADLKAVRESIGITQIDLANEMHVTVRTIKRWEQIGWEEPPEELWELLDDMVYDHERSVDDLVKRAEEEAERSGGAEGGAQEPAADDAEGGAAESGAAEDAGAEGVAAEPKVIYLAYYKNQKHYDCFPHQRGTTHSWGNAIARRAADILRFKGYRVFFYYPDYPEGYQGGED